jgi:hypothetical protein
MRLLLRLAFGTFAVSKTTPFIQVLYFSLLDYLSAPSEIREALVVHTRQVNVITKLLKLSQ